MALWGHGGCTRVSHRTLAPALTQPDVREAVWPQVLIFWDVCRLEVALEKAGPCPWRPEGLMPFSASSKFQRRIADGSSQVLSVLGIQRKWVFLWHMRAAGGCVT